MYLELESIQSSAQHGISRLWTHVLLRPNPLIRNSTVTLNPTTHPLPISYSSDPNSSASTASKLSSFNLCRPARAQHRPKGHLHAQPEGHSHKGKGPLEEAGALTSSLFRKEARQEVATSFCLNWCVARLVATLSKGCAGAGAMRCKCVITINIRQKTKSKFDVMMMIEAEADAWPYLFWFLCLLLLALCYKLQIKDATLNNSPS